MNYKIGDIIEIDNLDTMDELLEAGYGAKWIGVGVLMITSIPGGGNNETRNN